MVRAASYVPVRVNHFLEELLQGIWGGVIGDMIAVFFVLCHFLGKMQLRQIRDIQIVNFSLFAWRYVKHIARKLR